MKRFGKAACALLSAASLVLGLLAGCSSTPAASPSPIHSTVSSDTAAGGDTVEMTDLQGTTVTVPSPANLKTIAITSYKGALGASVLLGQIDKVAAMCDSSQYPWLQHAFPKLATLPDYGSFSEVNVEQVLQSGVDVVISPSSADDVNQQMRDLGITVLVDGVNIEDSSDVFKQTYDEIDLMAELTGTTDVAQRYYQWADETYALVNERVKDIPDEERVTVLPIRTDLTQVYGNNGVWGYVVELAGGINLSKDATANTGNFFTDVDPEQLVAWNPDFIFQCNFYGPLDEVTSENYNTWAKDARYQDITAFQNGDVYLFPCGIDHWDCANEAPLGVLWMAKLMYPDRFEDVDVKAYAEKFYQEFLDYTLTEEDWAILAPQYNDANFNGLNSSSAT